MKPLVVVGSVNADLVTKSARLPEAGETVTGTEFHVYPGGKGANQAVAAARLGRDVRFVGKTGNDAFGAELRASLTQAGVNIECLGETSGASGVAVINIDARGQNRIVVVPGANDQVTPAYLELHRSAMLSASAILAQLEIPLESVTYVAAMAAENGIPLVLDPAPAQALSRELIQRVSWLTPNLSEACTLSGSSLPDVTPKTAIEFAEHLLSLGPQGVLLKLGEQGLALATVAGVRAYVPAYNVTAVDTVAAGDALNAGFAVALTHGMAPERAAKWASAVAAISVTRPGAQPSMPRLDEVTAFVHERESGTLI